MSYYGFRLNDQKDWTKIKEFKTIQEYKDYIETREIMAQMDKNELIAEFDYYLYQFDKYYYFYYY